MFIRWVDLFLCIVQYFCRLCIVRVFLIICKYSLYINYINSFLLNTQVKCLPFKITGPSSLSSYVLKAGAWCSIHACDHVESIIADFCFSFLRNLSHHFWSPFRVKAFSSEFILFHTPFPWNCTRNPWSHPTTTDKPCAERYCSSRHLKSF